MLTRIAHTAIGRHRGGRLASKGVGLVSRSGALTRWARSSGVSPPMNDASSGVSPGRTSFCGTYSPRSGTYIISSNGIISISSSLA